MRRYQQMQLNHILDELHLIAEDDTIDEFHSS